MADQKKRDMKVSITAEEGQTLLRVAASFGLPEKLGDGTPYNVAERALAAKDVQFLYRELRARSPMMSKDRRMCFGPDSNWVKKGEEAGGRWEMANFSLPVEIRLSEDALSGAYWCALLMAHPGSPLMLNVGSQEEVLWPLAKKLRFVSDLEKAIGLDKAVHKRLDLDPEDEDKPKGPTLVEDEEVLEKT